MKRYLVTYGDARFAGAKARIVREAKATGELDEVIAYGPEEVSLEVKQSPLWSERRGGGYWIWKPDIIYQTFQKANDGDIVVYVDGGCEITKGREWKKYWRILERKDVLVHRIYQLNRNWTRQSVREAFDDIPKNWLNQCQFMATVVFFKKTAMSVKLVSEWRRLMIEHPEMVGDVTVEERCHEPPELIENRHDQTILSALVYRCLADPSTRGHIDARWEHIENISPFRSQVIRSMRNRTSIPVSISRRVKEMLLRIAKDVLRKPYFMLKTLHFCP